MGSFKLLYSQEFTSTDTIIVNHSLDRYQVAVAIDIPTGTTQGIMNDPSIIDSIIIDPLSPRNSLTVKLKSPQTGVIKVLDSTYVWGYAPSPEESAEISQLTSSAHSPGGLDTQIQFNNSGEFSGSANLAWENASNTLTVNGGISGSVIYGDGSNLTNLPSFGSEFESTESLAEQITTSTTYQSAMSFVTQNLPAGNYLLFWSGECSKDTGNGTGVKIYKGATTYSEINPKDANGTYVPFSGFAVESGISGIQTYDLDFKSESSGKTVRIRNLRMMIWRQS
jgi:hypothetical protein